MTFGCAIFKTGLIDRLTATRRRSAILRAFRMVADTSTSGLFDVDHDMSEDTQISVVTEFTGVEVWFGFSVGYMIEAMFQARLDLPRFEGLFIAHEKGSRTQMHQYVQAGRYGPGAMIPIQRRASWHRTFRRDDFPIPQCLALDHGITTLAQDLGAPRDLVQRAFSGMSGRGFYGLAWHAEKTEWVIARSLAESPDLEPAQVQGLNPNTYSRRGKPFERVSHPGPGDGFLTQVNVFYEVQHRAIAYYLGFRLDTTPALDRLSATACNRFDVRLINR